MPALIRPPGLNGKVRALLKVMGNEASAATLRMLSASGPLTTAQVAERLGVSHSRGAHRVLVDLRDQGLVTSTTIDGRGTLEWTVVADALPRAAQRWLDFASGAPIDDDEPPAQA
ncbi:MAG: hypothetical protein AAGC63_15020 [Propionicimonas sp.]